MKRKKEMQELKMKSLPELLKGVSEYEKKVWVLRNDARIGKLKNMREIRGARKHIARLLTHIGSMRSHKATPLQREK